MNPHATKKSTLPSHCPDLFQKAGLFTLIFLTLGLVLWGSCRMLSMTRSSVMVQAWCFGWLEVDEEEEDFSESDSLSSGEVKGLVLFILLPARRRRRMVFES
jgi:hypothetical protein